MRGCRTKQSLHARVERIVDRDGEQPDRLYLGALALVLLDAPVQIEQRGCQQADRNDRDQLDLEEMPADAAAPTAARIARADLVH